MASKFTHYQSPDFKRRYHLLRIQAALAMPVADGDKDGQKLKRYTLGHHLLALSFLESARLPNKDEIEVLAVKKLVDYGLNVPNYSQD